MVSAPHMVAHCSFSTSCSIAMGQQRPCMREQHVNAHLNWPAANTLKIPLSSTCRACITQFLLQQGTQHTHLLNAAADCRVADVGVDLDLEVAPNDCAAAGNIAQEKQLRGRWQLRCK